MKEGGDFVVDKTQSSAVERWEKTYCPYCGV
jgi:hypothetical protein